MATFLNKIDKMRGDLHDRPRRTKDTFDGDAATTVFETTESPIRASSYTVKIGGVTQTEGSSDDYTVDLNLGLITFASAPASGSDNVEIVYQNVKITDDDYLTIFNDSLDYFKDSFWSEEFDETSHNTVKDQFQYDMDTVDANIFWVVNVQVESASGKGDWGAVTNWKYLPQLNKIEFNPPFSAGGLSLRFHVLKRFSEGSATGDTFPVAERYVLPFEYYVKSRFYERLVPEKIDQIGAVTTNASFIPGPSVINISQYYLDLANNHAKKIAPRLPNQALKQIQDGKII
jgi:hypothetical protein